jgi:hypothetical protein
MNLASLCSLAGRYNNPIPTRFLAPIDCLKIPALAGQYENPIPTRFVAPIDCYKIAAQNVSVKTPLSLLFCKLYKGNVVIYCNIVNAAVESEFYLSNFCTNTLMISF